MQKIRLKRKVQKIFDHTVFWVLTYPSFVLGILFFGLLRLTGRVRVEFPDRLPRWQTRMIIASNHPSLWEPILLMVFMARETLLSPLKFTPWSTPDEGNYRRWYWVFSRQRFIFVPRGRRRGELRAMARVIKVLRSGKRVIIFPEGGRTCNGRKFHTSKKGNRIRSLKRGLGRVACESGATVVPVWIEGAERVLPLGSVFPRIWRPVTIKIGHPLDVSRTTSYDKEDLDDAVAVVMHDLSNALLDLADE